MTTLTPNRIIQQGDEYRNNGTWKAVPEEDYGLQVMFTKYAEVRRASETPFVHGGAPAIKVESQQGSETETRHAHNVEKAGSTPAPAKPISPVSEKPPEILPDIGHPDYVKPLDIAEKFEKAIKAAGLPTVVSVKAHQDAIEHPEFVGHVPSETEQAIANASEHLSPAALENFKRRIAAEEHAKRLTATHKTETEKAIETAKAMGVTIDTLDLRWPNEKGCTWTGRNGTFDGIGMEIRNMGDKVSLCPRGKRGLGNGEIQFPRAVIPQIVDWLLRQQTTPTT